MPPITRNNYLGAYCTWCNQNGKAPLRYDVLAEVFYGLESNEEFEIALKTLYKIQSEALAWSFMKDTQTLDALMIRLKIRLELFNRIPTSTNMLLAYNLIEDITLKIAASGTKDMLDKDIERFDKLKNLALGTKYVNERKLAFERSVGTFRKLIGEINE